MHPRTALLCVGLTVILSPLLMGHGLAGTADDPELVDPSDDTSHGLASTYADLVAGWLNETDDAIVAYTRLAVIEGPAEEAIYGFAFRTPASADCLWYFVAMTFNATDIDFFWGETDFCASDFGRVSYAHPTNGTGPQHNDPTWSAEVPRDRIDGLSRGDNLTEIRALVFSSALSAGRVAGNETLDQTAMLDEATTEVPYTIRLGPVPENATRDTAGGDEPDEALAPAREETPSETPSRAAESPGSGVVVLVVGLVAYLGVRQRVKP